MANLKISQLAALAEADVAAADVLAVADISASETKKVTAADTVKAGARLNTGTVTFGGDVAITGNLNVNGTTTTIDTQNLLVEDKNIELGAVASPTDVTADGGGILLQGTTPKLFAWADATDSWTSSENIDLGSGKSYRINGTEVLSGTTLGTGVVNSSLTSLGTVTTGTWSASTIAVDKGGTGDTSYVDGELLIGNSTGNTLTKSTLTAGSGVTITNGNGSITISATGAGGTITAVTATSPLASSGGTTPDISIQDGTTAQKGAVQLEDSTSSTSTTTAATPNSVKSAYDLADAALPKAGGTVTGDVLLENQSDLRFGEATGHGGNWVALQAPSTVSANVTWTLPDADGTSGQVLSTDGSGTLSWASGATGSVSSVDVTGGTGLTSSGGPITSSGTITVDLDNTAVTPGSYTYASITVDQQGRLTAASNGTAPLTSSDIGSTVQGYDADTAKTDVAQTFTAQQTFGELKETVYTLGTSGSIALDPANGSIQSSVLTGAPTFTDSLEAGQTVVLMLEGGASYSVTWPTTTWVTSAGNAAPTLTAKDTLVFWKVSTTLYGAYVGSYV